MQIALSNHAYPPNNAVAMLKLYRRLCIIVIIQFESKAHASPTVARILLRISAPMALRVSAVREAASLFSAARRRR